MPRSENSLLRPLKTLALGVWLAMAASIGVAAWLWRSWDPHPHAAWAAVSIASVLGTSAWLTLRALRVATRGRSPGPALGWWLIGTAPLVWFIAYAANLYLDATHRQPMPFDAPMRMAAAWGTSFFDIEARLRYPRWTYGKQALLMETGNLKEPELLVEKMDEHIASMTRVLGQPPLSAPVIWIRGSIFGLKGNSTGSWAICGPNNSDSLESLDRHEAAHATISMLAGPHHDPPAVLVEGWAESQSTDRDAKIRQLAEMREAGDVYSLGELIEPNWYGRSDGPVYSHGGPLVHYLFERFGAPKFFTLYRDARRANFPDDCRRILGVPWGELDADFWKWVAAENDRIAADEPQADNTAKEWKLELADDVNPADWQRLAKELKESRSDRTLPKRITFAMRWDWKRLDDKHEAEPITSENELMAVFDGEDFWICDRSDSESFLMSSNGRAASLTLTRSGDVEGWVGDAASRRRAQNEATQFVQAYRNAGNFWPERWLPIGDTYRSPATYRLERIERPADGAVGTWKVAGSIEHHDDDVTQYCELEVDPALAWQVIRCTVVATPQSYSEQSAKYRQIDGIWFATAGKFEANYIYIKEQVSAETSFRTLTDDEVRDLKRRVERMAAVGPTRPWHRLRSVLLAMVVAWPVVGLLCVALPSKRQRLQSYGDPSASKEATVTATTAPTSGPTTGIQE